jgi:hypothetical protein
MCTICQLPTQTRLEIEALIKDNVAVRVIGERYSLGKNIVQKHKNVCMCMAPTDSASKVRLMAEKLEAAGDYKGAGGLYMQITNAGDSEQEDIYSYLGRIAPRLCPDCKKLILEG